MHFCLQKGNTPIVRNTIQRFHKAVMVTKESYPMLEWIKEPVENKCYSN